MSKSKPRIVRPTPPGVAPPAPLVTYSLLQDGQSGYIAGPFSLEATCLKEWGHAGLTIVQHSPDWESKVLWRWSNEEAGWVENLPGVKRKYSANVVLKAYVEYYEETEAVSAEEARELMAQAASIKADDGTKGLDWEVTDVEDLEEVE
jgi:hypothetical protein